MLTYGIEPLLPFEFPPLEPATEEEVIVSRIEQLLRLEAERDLALEKLEEGQVRQQEYYQKARPTR